MEDESWVYEYKYKEKHISKNKLENIQFDDLKENYTHEELLECTMGP